MRPGLRELLRLSTNQTCLLNHFVRSRIALISPAHLLATVAHEQRIQVRQAFGEESSEMF